MSGLPSTPLKATEKRADPWRAAMGVEQTEIDALASLRPDLLRQVAEDAIGPFYDRTLDGRVFAARGRWLDQAQEAVERAADAAQLQAIRDSAAEQLENMRRQIRQLNAALGSIQGISTCRRSTSRSRDLTAVGRRRRSSTRAGHSRTSAGASSHPRHTTRATFRPRMPHRPPGD
jgi:hypothetical protein